MGGLASEGMREHEGRRTAKGFSEVDVGEARRVGHQDVGRERAPGDRVGHVGRQIAAVHDLNDRCADIVSRPHFLQRK
jgi:hypothetical protein